MNSVNGEGSNGPDVTVIGAGLVGLATALRLQCKGLSVQLFDESGPGMECSYGNAGAVSPGSVAPLAMPGILSQARGLWLDPKGPLYVRLSYLAAVAPWLFRFVSAAHPERVEEIAGALSALLSPALTSTQRLLRSIGRTDLLRATGQLHLYPSKAARAKDDASWQLRRSHGVNVEPLDAAEVLALEPAVGERYRQGVFLPEQGLVINPHEYALALSDAFKRSGGTLLRDSVTALAHERGRVRAIYTRESRYDAKRLVIAAGAWSNGLLAQLGQKVPLETQRGYHVMIPQPSVTLKRPVVAADRKVFVSPMDIGLRIAGTVEFAGLRRAPDYRRAMRLLQPAMEVFPELASDAPGSVWMGHRPCLPDSLPVLGRSPWHANVWHAFGHGHLGLTAAAITAEHLAASIVGETPAIDLTAYRADRFQ